MEYLRRRNVGSALNYSAEADGEIESDHAELDRLREVETALDVQGALEQRMHAEGWERGSSAFALKVVSCTIQPMTHVQTGLIDPTVLTCASITLHRLRAAHHKDYEAAVPFPGCPSDSDDLLLCPQHADTAQFDEYTKAVPSMSVSSSDPGVQQGDLEKIQTLWRRLDTLAERAQRNG
jgi:proline dehydrogenase